MGLEKHYDVENLISVTLTTVFEGPWLFPSKDPVENAGVDHAAVQAKVIVERWTDISNRVQLFPHP